MTRLIEDLRERFQSAKENAERTERIAPNSYEAGYDRGYSDSLGEFLESIMEDAARPLTMSMFLNKADYEAAKDELALSDMTKDRTK